MGLISIMYLLPDMRSGCLLREPAACLISVRSQLLSNRGRPVPELGQCHLACTGGRTAPSRRTPARCGQTSQTGSRAPDLDYRAHGGPVFRTLMRVIIETAHLVTVLYRYDRDPAGGMRDVSPLRDCATRLAKWHWGEPWRIRATMLSTGAISSQNSRSLCR